jgi:hypothetical protein
MKRGNRALTPAEVTHIRHEDGTHACVVHAYGAGRGAARPLVGGCANGWLDGCARGRWRG